MTLQAAGAPALLWTAGLQTGLLSSSVPLLGFAFIINFTKHNFTKQTPAQSWLMPPQSTMGLPVPQFLFLSIDLPMPLELPAWLPNQQVSCPDGFVQLRARWLIRWSRCLPPCLFCLFQSPVYVTVELCRIHFWFTGILLFNEASEQICGRPYSILVLYLQISTFTYKSVRQNHEELCPYIAPFKQQSLSVISHRTTSCFVKMLPTLVPWLRHLTTMNTRAQRPPPGSALKENYDDHHHKIYF